MHRFMYFNRIQSKTTVALNICTSILALLTDFVTSKNNAPTKILLAVMNDTFHNSPDNNVNQSFARQIGLMKHICKK